MSGATAGDIEPDLIHACRETAGGHIRTVASASDCLAVESYLQWNRIGPQGPEGPVGPTGQQGETGPTGPQGPPGPSDIKALEATPCRFDGEDGKIMTVTDGVGEIHLFCIVTSINFPSAWYRDRDGDGYGRGDELAHAPTALSGYAAVPGDCDDSDPDIWPGAPERNNGIDDDCDGEPEPLIPSPGDLVINEFDANQPGTDTSDFIELFNLRSEKITLEGLVIETINSAGSPVEILHLSGTLDGGGYLVIWQDSFSLLSDTGGILLYRPGESIDFVVYEDGHAPVDDDDGHDSVGRCPDGQDTDVSADDFIHMAPPTPGARNGCP